MTSLAGSKIEQVKLSPELSTNRAAHRMDVGIPASLALYAGTARRVLHEDAILFALHDQVSILTAIVAVIVVLIAWRSAGGHF